MIRKMQDTDLDAVAEIWLDTNIKAHDFIPSQYWKDNFEAVKGIFPAVGTLKDPRGTIALRGLFLF